MNIDHLFRRMRIGQFRCAILLLVLLLTLIPTRPVVALPGDLDPSFLEPNPTGATPTDPGFYVGSFAEQPDGKIVVGGHFFEMNKQGRDRLARLNSDGTLDMTFGENFYIDYSIYTVVVLGDGDILIGGSFKRLNGNKPMNHIMRLNSDGTLDTAFTSAIDPGNSTSVSVILPLPDGDLLVGGSFSSVGGVARPSIARLNPDGTLDTAFMQNNTGPAYPGNSPMVTRMVRQPNGKIIIGGYFTLVDSMPRKNIARLEADGTLDVSFMYGYTNPGADGMVSALELDPSGNVLVGGYFTNFHNSNPKRSYMVRLSADGILDPSFQPTFGPVDYVQIRTITRLSSGNLLVSGGFETVNGAPRGNIVMLNSDGTTNTSFMAGKVGTNLSVIRALVQTDGKILIGGTFTRVNGISRNMVARLTANGSLDSEFLMAGANHEVNAVAVQPGDGKVLVGGRFSVVNGLAQTGFVRLNTDGSTDASFVRTMTGVSGGGGRVNAIALQPDGGILIGGNFTKAAHRDANNVARIDTYGNPDWEFNTAGAKGTDGEVFGIALQPDGKIVVVGSFQNAGEMARKYIARFKTDGTLDTAFVPAVPDKMVYTVAVQVDGKIIIAGEFTAVNGQPRGKVARLNADGSLDEGYLNGVAGANNLVRWVDIDPDGNTIIGGFFTSVNGAPFSRIARLSKTDGSPDPAFMSGMTGPDNGIRALEVQPNGTIVIGGEFFAVNGTECKHIAVLNPDGSLNPNFGCQGAGGINGGWVNSVAMYRGAIFIGGDFTEVRGVERGRVAKLEGVNFRVFTPLLMR